MIWIDYVVLFAYFIGMVAIGIWSMRRVHGQEDYFMGGRGFGKLLQTFAAFGAGTGAHEPVNVGRTAWTSGLSGVWSALMWLFVTPVYWIVGVWYRRMRHLTLGDWFVERYESPAMGVAYTLFAIAFYMAYLSTMLSAISAFSVPLLGVDQLLGIPIEMVLVPALAIVVILYGVLGGLRAAYYTDLVQGIFIILLSVLLIPTGLRALVEQFGDPQTMGIGDGFRILHQRVAPDYFNLFGGPAAGEFPWHYIVALSVLGLVGIVVQPHFIATGGGSAKSEDEARVGLVVGNFLKRLCTVGWAMTALIALALLAGNHEIALDPDRVWGVAAREVLGPMKLGLVGLMLACLMAAMMSSADAYMIVTSGLVTRNVYAAYVDADADEKTYVLVGRITGLIVVVGAAAVALWKADVFGQFKMALELPILFAAPFWLGMCWRRANRTAVWWTMLATLAIFFVLPPLLPTVIPSLRTSPTLTQKSDLTITAIDRPATAADVARYEAWRALKEQADRNPELAEKLGTQPPAAQIGQPITVEMRSGGASIFWSGGLEPIAGGRTEIVEQRQEGNRRITVVREVGQFRGLGSLNIEFLGYQWLGVDLTRCSRATLETLRLPPRVLTPFLILIVFSFLTPRNRQEALDRFYVKMKTEVLPDPEADRQELARSYADPHRFDHRKLFPDSDVELVRPRAKDVIGFIVCIGVCVAIIGLLAWLAQIGA
ncbi:MAG: hypothetical protein KatS3mg111_2617 [Pirellulaceae bacterium]|nr:MAG: hypothetical protein KatS3mg111_2617 [Pirellulaceae bacterium]